MSGKIGKELIYRDRKKIKDVKKYAIPYNPKTGDQGVQRDHLKNANLAWKTDGYSDIDIKAWGLYAGIQKRILSGYNIFLSEKINASKDNKTWNKLKDCIISDITGSSCIVTVNVDSDKSGKLYIGQSIYSMLKEIVGVFDTDHYTFTIGDMDLQKKYYFYIENTAVNEVARTGIYSFKTIETGPIIIEIGKPAINRAGFYGTTVTLVNMGVIANANGRIKSVEIWAYSELTDCKVATFFEVSENYLSTREYANIGTVTPGSKQIFPVDLAVEAGDFIGMYVSAHMERTTFGEPGLWYRNNDQIPCVNAYYSIREGDAISLLGKGVG